MDLLTTPGGNSYPDEDAPVDSAALRGIALNRDGRDRELLIQAQSDATDALTPRLEALEARDGLDAGAVTDSSVASVVSQPDTLSRAAVLAVTSDRYTAHAEDETITGDWTVSKGLTPDTDPPRFGLERMFRKSEGALYDADTRLEFRVSKQQGSTQTPPGYSMAEIALIDTNATNDPQMHGEANTIKLISNRTLFSRRVEVNMGGRGRAVLSAGTQPGDAYLRLMMHNPTSPELRIYGETHPTADASMAHLMEGRLKVEYSRAETTTPVEVLGRDSSRRAQGVRVRQGGDGTQELEFTLDGERVGAITAHAFNDALRLYGAGGVLVMGGDLTLRPGFGPVLRSPDGESWRLTVSNTGAVTAVKL